MKKEHLPVWIAFAVMGLVVGQEAVAVPERATIRAFLYEGTTTVQTPLEACEKWRDGFNRTYEGVASITGPRAFKWEPPGKYETNQPGLRCLFSSVQNGQAYPVDWRAPGEAICRPGTYFDPATLTCDCLPGFAWSETSGQCEVLFHQNHDKPNKGCGFGNPIYPLTGAKRSTEILGDWFPNWLVTLQYDTRSKLPGITAETFRLRPAESFGELWESTTHKRLVVQNSGSTWAIQASRGTHQWVTFVRDGSRYRPDSDIADKLTSVGGGWHYTDASARSLETYDSQGALTSIAFSQGGKLIFSYSDSTTPASVAPSSGLLIKIENQFGRSAQFEYERPAGISTPRIARIVDPSGKDVRAAYDVLGNLDSLTWPDGKVRKFLYEQNAMPWALTGVIDENDSRLSTFAYDADGRAQSTEYAGGANRYSVSYASPPQWLVTDSVDAAGLRWRGQSWQPPQDAVVTTPNGHAVQLGVALINGMPRVATRSQPAGAGCDAATSHLTYDANGNVASKTDFNGSRSCYAYDLTRNLEVARVEGLAAEAECNSVLPDGATLPTGTRKTVTQYHPDWRLPVMVREPRKLTTYVYHGQPDPFNASAVASCAPSNAVLPDGKPAAVLCKRVEQATTDPSGASGLAGATGDGSLQSDSFANQVVLQLSMDGVSGATSFPDASSHNHTPVTVVSPVVIDTNNAMAGAAAANFTGGYLQYADSVDWDMGGSDFTLETWVKFNSEASGARAFLFGKAASDGSSSTLSVSKFTDDLLRLSWVTTGGTGRIVDTAPVVANTWYRLVVVRSGNTIFFWKNGQLVASAAIVGSFIPNANKFGVGVIGDYAYAYGGAYGTRMMGWLDEFRITKGVARYADTLNANIPARSWTYTYNQYGQVLTARDPLNKLTTYAYYSDTTDQHTMGDLQSVIDSAGRVTQFTRYDKSGRLMLSIDANGTVTDTTYTPRGWVKTVTVTASGAAAQASLYDYDGVGQLKKATLPDGSALEYTYDAAHRLTGVMDTAGNSVTYTLDNMGNRTGEDLKDPNGTLARNITRVYDALNRAQSTTGTTQ